MHCRCIAIDCRGYGDTDKPSGINAYDINVLADDISNLAKALKTDTFTLVGHDWGGMIGYQVCLRWVPNQLCMMCTDLAFKLWTRLRNIARGQTRSRREKYEVPRRTHTS